MMLHETTLPTRLWLAAGPSQSDDGPIQERMDIEPSAASLRVAIVEDEFYIALDIEQQLADLGHASVGIAVTADQAIALVQRERPDLVLMDVRLAGHRDGIDAAEEILSRFGIRSIFVTANTDPHTRRRAAAVQPIGFLEKPLTQQRLRAILDTWSRER